MASVRKASKAKKPSKVKSKGKAKAARPKSKPKPSKKDIAKRSSKPAPKKKAATAKRAAPKRAKPLASAKKPARRTKAKTVIVGPAPVENPRAHAIARSMAAAVLDKKAIDVVILDVRGKASYADYIVLASGESQPQVRAMAEGIEAKLKAEGERPQSREGEEAGSWLLLDYGEVVAHLFDTDARGFYDLEGLWADAPRERVQS